MHVRALALVAIGIAILGTAGCPSGKPCADSRDCSADEVCVSGADGNTCQPSPPGSTTDAGPAANDAGLSVPDAGPAPDDAGLPLDDAGPGPSDAGPEVDAGSTSEDAGPGIGRTLRGGIDVGAGTVRGQSRTLRGHIHGIGPAPRVSTGARTLDTPGR